MPSSWSRSVALGLLAILSAAICASAPASAVVIELKDVASDRVERQRAEAIGQLPLPGTPNVGQLAERLAEKQMAIGNPILIRVFKASSELEIWMQRGERLELFATYPICNWSGTLGPKLTEGDKQSPEGVYTVTSRQLHLVGRHPRSLNLGFPNALDRQMSRTGSYILIHGACSSVGCFAMTNPVIEEIYMLASAALKSKQDAVQVHVFPFRMTEERLKAYALNEWYDFWRNLKDVSDSFERTHLPPKISICEARYWVEDSAGEEEVASHGPLAVCAASQVEAASPSAALVNADQDPILPWWQPRAMLPPALVPSRPSAPMLRHPRDRWTQIAPWSHQYSALQFNAPLLSVPNSRVNPTGDSLLPTTITAAVRANRQGGRPDGRSQQSKVLPQKIPCSMKLTSCRHWIAANQAMALARNARNSRLAASRH